MLFMIVRSVHILAAILFTCGVAAYLVTLRAMREEKDMRAVGALMRLIGRIMPLMMRPGGMLLVIFGLWTAYYESWPRFSIEAIGLLVIFVPFMVLIGKGSHKLQAAVAEALQVGSVTPALEAALQDRKLKIGNWGVGIITILFLLLMLIKPA